MVNKRLARIERMEVCLRQTLQDYPGADREATIAYFMEIWPDTTRRTVCEYLGLVMKRNNWLADNNIIKKDPGTMNKTQSVLGVFGQDEQNENN